MSDDIWYNENAGNFSSSDLFVRAVIDLYGSVDPYQSAYFGEKFLAKLNAEVIGVSLGQNPYLYRNFSSPFLVGPSTPPTLIIHGALDRIVYPIESQTLYNSLNEASNSSRIYLKYNLGSHGFDAFGFTPGGQLADYFIERFIWLNYFKSKSVELEQKLE